MSGEVSGRFVSILATFTRARSGPGSDVLLRQGVLRARTGARSTSSVHTHRTHTIQQANIFKNSSGESGKFFEVNTSPQVLYVSMTL